MSPGIVKEFYNGKTILITGATGYIGRLMIAKLMRLENLKQIVLLSRPKKGISNEERLDKILSGFLFEEMDKFDPSFRSKLKVVNGDMEIEDLGMSSEDREYIKQHVEIIIHGAATVRFDEEIKKAIRINIRGTKNMLDLGVECESLLSFVHISTAYSQCPRSEIKEVFYEPPMDYKQALQLLDLADDQASVLTDKAISPWPNTYTFTKAISEDMIRQYQEKLPVAIIRPSVVVSTLKDPVAGYSDSILGALGGALGVGLGLIRVMKMSTNTYCDLIPSDIVINYTLVIGWITATTTLNMSLLPSIYNCCSGNIYQTPNNEVVINCVETMRKHPVKQMIWYPTFTQISSDKLFRFLYFLYHYVPAFFVDIVLRITKSKYRLVSIYSKVFLHLKLLSYFVERSWKFHDDNKFEIYRLMNDEDHKCFQCKVTREEGSTIFENSCIGFSKYFFKQTEADLAEARKKYKILFAAHYLFLAVFYTILGYFLYQSVGKNLVNQLQSYLSFYKF